MDKSQTVINDVLVSRVSDGSYFPVAMELIRRAHRRCLVSMFIVDYDMLADPMARIDRLLVALITARWRGAEVKILVGGSRENGPILESAVLAVARAQQLGLDVRLAASVAGNNSHVKLLIADDLVLSGSHNWSRGIFGSETQDSVLFDDGKMSALLASYFSEQWYTASEDPLYVPL
jgi:phosphatidylserine/phosphatidylglycerophosphate/cardiolipin synthase-like enzyme